MAANQNANEGALTLTDIENLARRYIPTDLAARAEIRRVSHEDGADIVGRPASTSEVYAGLVIPYCWPGETSAREYRLRRDLPSLELQPDGTTKERGKYLSPPGRANLLYFPPDTFPEYLVDCSVPVVFVEGELKALALWRMFDELGHARLIVGLSGVWNWRGKVGKTTDEDGRPRDVKGPISDLARIEFDKRRVYVVFDANVGTNESVRAARSAFASELAQRGAEVFFVEIPALEGVNGADDLLHLRGVGFVADLFEKAIPAPEWQRRAANPPPCSREERAAIRETLNGYAARFDEKQHEDEDATRALSWQEVKLLVDAESAYLSTAGIGAQGRNFFNAVFGAMSEPEKDEVEATDYQIGMRMRSHAEKLSRGAIEAAASRGRKDFIEAEKATGCIILDIFPGGMEQGRRRPTLYRLRHPQFAFDILDRARLDPDFNRPRHRYRAIRKAAEFLVQLLSATAPRKERFRRRGSPSALTEVRQALTLTNNAGRKTMIVDPETSQTLRDAAARLEEAIARMAPDAS